MRRRSKQYARSQLTYQDAGVSTIFVGLGEDPHVLAQRSPGLFQAIEETYPKVVQGVPRRS
jgi:hypothetical protein